MIYASSSVSDLEQSSCHLVKRKEVKLMQRKVPQLRVRWLFP